MERENGDSGQEKLKKNNGRSARRTTKRCNIPHRFCAGHRTPPRPRIRQNTPDVSDAAGTQRGAAQMARTCADRCTPPRPGRRRILCTHFDKNRPPAGLPARSVSATDTLCRTAEMRSVSPVRWYLRPADGSRVSSGAERNGGKTGCGRSQTLCPER